MRPSFIRLLYWGQSVLGMGQADVWLTPLGLLLDLIECHRQHTGTAQPAWELFSDEVIPFGV